MKIVDIRELSVPLEGDVANAVVSFAEHDVSLVAVVSDVVRNGKPVIGLAFNSIGRFAQRGILCDRIIPRLRAAQPKNLLADDGPPARSREGRSMSDAQREARRPWRPCCRDGGD